MIKWWPSILGFVWHHSYVRSASVHHSFQPWDVQVNRCRTYDAKMKPRESSTIISIRHLTNDSSIFIHFNWSRTRSQDYSLSNRPGPNSRPIGVGMDEDSPEAFVWMEIMLGVEDSCSWSFCLLSVEDWLGIEDSISTEDRKPTEPTSSEASGERISWHPCKSNSDPFDSGTLDVTVGWMCVHGIKMKVTLPWTIHPTLPSSMARQLSRPWPG